MFKIIKKKILAPAIKQFDVEAKAIAAKAEPGQFVILRIDEKGERIPLTIADFDREKGYISLIFQEVGRSTLEMGEMNEGDSILDLVGPLGKASHVENFGRVICIGGGVGVAPIYPINRALKQAGNHISSIIGARNQESLILTQEMQKYSDELYIVTDDGSGGEKGFVTDQLKEILTKDAGYDLIVTIGPLPMMQAVSELTAPFNIKTIVSLNPIMVDGTGMCGGCRVQVGNENKFACVDGPEFDGHQVDWQNVIQRSRIFKHQEKTSLGIHQSGGGCQCKTRK
ncbi:MAG: sulfide/dihydroorotate dehydrogenase-like FAD/NAD-binding protein [Bacillota bacterium]|nr:sulfide/dihydroorotate dehydrogenase-like FAD/NAD-binding protein [Bacillota bacterium]